MMVTMAERMARIEEKVDNLVVGFKELKDFLISDKGFVGKTNTDIESIKLRLAKQEGIMSTLKFIFGGGIILVIFIAGIKIFLKYVS